MPGTATLVTCRPSPHRGRSGSYVPSGRHPPPPHTHTQTLASTETTRRPWLDAAPSASRCSHRLGSPRPAPTAHLGQLRVGVGFPPDLPVLQLRGHPHLQAASRGPTEPFALVRQRRRERARHRRGSIPQQARQALDARRCCCMCGAGSRSCHLAQWPAAAWGAAGIRGRSRTCDTQPLTLLSSVCASAGKGSSLVA